MAFVGKAPHLDAMEALRPHMGDVAFVRWSVRGSDLPFGVGRRNAPRGVEVRVNLVDPRRVD